MHSTDRIIIEQNLSLMSQGQYEKVHSTALSMIHSDIHNALPYLLLAKLCYDHKNFNKSAELFEKSLSLDPENPYSRVYFAQLLTDVGEHVQARETIATLSKGDVESAHLFDTLGVIYSRLGFHEKAIDWFMNAVKADDKPANFHYNLAASLQFMGQFELAKYHYEATLNREPSTYRALASLVSLNKQHRGDNRLDELLIAFEKIKEDADSALHVGHALAKTFEDFGDYEKSFEWLQKAKALKQHSANSVDYRDIFDAVIEASPSLGEILVTEEYSDAAPIFIVGLPRTGTTLVDRIISSHPDATTGGELNAFAEIIKRHTKTKSNYVLDRETMAQINKVDFNAVGHEYMKATKALYRNALRCTDKMPLNFFYAGLINRALPNARIIALRRGAMDSCLSNYRQLLTSRHSYYDYTYNLSSTAAFYKQYDRLMTNWRETLPQDRFMEIQYEDIVFDQEAQTQKLLAFCGLSWDEACMRFHENDAPVATASSVQVRQPLYSGSIGRWKRYNGLLDELQNLLVGYD